MHSERSQTYMATYHPLDTGPRGQPWWCHPLVALPNDHMATQHHCLHTSWASYKQPHSCPFVPSQYVDTHRYPRPGDPNSQWKHPQVLSTPVDLGKVGSGCLATGRHRWGASRWNHAAHFTISNDYPAFWSVDPAGGIRCSCILLISF